VDYSPTLAAVTAVFETTVAFWALGWLDRPLERVADRFRCQEGGDAASAGRTVLRIAAAILFLLAGYQVAEIAICARPATAGFLPRLAFLIVTWLPPLGLLLIAKLRRPRSAALAGCAFAGLAASGALCGWIIVDPGFAAVSVCSTVFAHYSHATPHFLVYAVYYWLGLLGMVVLSSLGIAGCNDRSARRKLGLVLVGTTAFVVPSLVASLLVPTEPGALPSIMCHFAVILAAALTRLVYLERSARRRSARSMPSRA